VLNNYSQATNLSDWLSTLVGNIFLTPTEDMIIEERDSELNATLLTENVTFDPRVTIPITARKPGRKVNAS